MKSEGINIKACLLLIAVFLVSAAVIVTGVCLEASTPAVDIFYGENISINGKWCFSLIVPATAFLLSTVNWFFIKFYKERNVFSLSSCLITFVAAICGYALAVSYYDIGFVKYLNLLNGDGITAREFGKTFVKIGSLSGFCVTAILCFVSKSLSNKYAKILGKEEKEYNVNKAITVLGYIFFGLIILLPLGTILCACVGYTFEFFNYTVFSVLTLLTAVVLVVLTTIAKEKISSKRCSALFTLSIPLSLINVSFYSFKTEVAFSVLCILACTGCCCYLAVMQGVELKRKKLFSAILILLTVPTIIISIFLMFFGGLSLVEVVDRASSPDDKYCAEVINCDEGALGGSTLVKVFENKGFDAFIFKVHKEPQEVYRGEWGEYKTMVIYWENEKRLHVNGEVYNME